LEDVHNRDQLEQIAVLPIYFRHRIANFLSTFPQGERGDRTFLTHPLSLVAIAFCGYRNTCLLLTKIIGKHLESLYIMGSALLIGGIAMWVIDAMNAKAEVAGPSAAGGRIHTWHMEEMSLGQAIWIGALPDLSAVFPGDLAFDVDQSGPGSWRECRERRRWSFVFPLDSTMVVATCYDLLKSLRGKSDNPIGRSTDRHAWMDSAGHWLVVSFVVAYGSVAWSWLMCGDEVSRRSPYIELSWGSRFLFWASRIGQ